MRVSDTIASMLEETRTFVCIFCPPKLGEGGLLPEQDGTRGGDGVRLKVRVRVGGRVRVRVRVGGRGNEPSVPRVRTPEA